MTMRCNNCNKETRVMLWDLCIPCTRKLAIDTTSEQDVK